MFLLAAASCGMVSCQQEEGLTSPTLAKSDSRTRINVGNYYFLFDTETQKATFEGFKSGVYSYDKVNEKGLYPDNVTYNNALYTVTKLSETATNVVSETADYTNTIQFKDVQLPAYLESIGNDCFNGEIHLQEITLPTTLVDIGSYAFSNCYSLETISIPKSVKTIQKGTFSNCSKLQSVLLPEELVGIQEYAFRNCKSLKEILFPPKIQYINAGAFENCTSLKSIDLPESVVKLTNYSTSSYTFAACTSLLSAKIPNVETICANCFDGDTQLQNVTLGTGVKNIEKEAFKDCSNLKQLCVYATTPPTLKDSNIFSSTNYENCTLYVPAEAEATYKAADGWKNFKNISTQFPDEQTAEEMQASFTDATPTLDEGTYKAGKLTYTRSGKNIIDGNYATFCLPFDINLADTKCFSDVLVPQNIALYQTNNDGMLTFLLDQVESDAIIPAGKPFIAKLNGNDVELKNYYSTFIRSTYQEDLKQNMETTIKVFNFDGSSGVLQRNNDVEVKFCGTFNKKAEMDKETTRTFTVRGSFAPDTSVSAFRAYIYKNSKSGNTQVSNLSWSLGDDLQSISSGNYIVDGNELIINK